MSCHRPLNLYPKFLHISHRENGSFDVLTLHYEPNSALPNHPTGCCPGAMIEHSTVAGAPWRERQPAPGSHLQIQGGSDAISPAICQGLQSRAKPKPCPAPELQEAASDQDFLDEERMSHRTKFVNSPQATRKFNEIKMNAAAITAYVRQIGNHPLYLQPTGSPSI